MLFKRRNPRSFWLRMSHHLYPRMGWRRYFLYWRARTLRLPGSASSIAKGFACGAAASFTPLLGFHLGLTILLCWIIGGNYIAGAIGTLVGNPFTLFPILLLVYKVGSWILGQSADPESIGHFVDALTNHPSQLWDSLRDVFQPIFLPMIAGAVPVGIVVWIITYFVSYRVIAEYKHLRVQHRIRKARSRRVDEGEDFNNL